MSTVKFKRSGSAGKVPLTTDLVAGEAALNTRDGLLYTLKEGVSPSVIVIGAEMSATLAAALKQASGPAFMEAIGLGSYVIRDIQGTLSGTAIEETGIPSWANEINIAFDRVTLSGTDNLLVQLGDSGGIETTGYNSAANGVSSTSGFIIPIGAGGNAFSGIVRLVNAHVGGLRWFASVTGAIGAAADLGGTVSAVSGGGIKYTSAALDRIRVTRTGTNTFDGGGVVVTYRA